MARPAVSVTERLWPKIDTSGPCWEWKGNKSPAGYGRFWAGRYTPKGQPTSEMAHRVVYELLVGPIPAGLQLDHLCRNTSCVNPAHLEPVTAQENTRRGTSPVATNLSLLACRRGHPFTEENTYRDRRGSRYCRACQRVRRLS